MNLKKGTEMPRRWTNAEVKHKWKPEATPAQPETYKGSGKIYRQDVMQPCPECAELLPHNLVERIADPEEPNYTCPAPKRIKRETQPV